jgi:hypothetical protein
MRNILFSFLTVISFNSIAQTPIWSWAKGPNGGGNVPGNSAVVADDSGNSYITGCFSNDTIIFGYDTLLNTDNSGTYDVYVVKYDPNGNVLWAKNAGGVYNDYGNAIAIDLSGNIYITGTFSYTIQFDTYSLNSIGSSDIFIAKYDINGNIIWAKREGCTSIDYANSITTDSDGNIYIVGGFRYFPIILGLDTLQNNGGSDMFLVKYDQSGVVQWAKKAGGTNDDTAPSLTIDDLGNVYVALSFYSSSIIFGADTLNNGNPGYADVAIVKYDTIGNAVWAKSTGGPNEDYTFCIKTDNLNGIFLTGYFYSPSIIFGLDTLNNSSTNKDVFIVKYNDNGDVIWAKSAGGIGADQGSYLTTDTSNNVYVVGYFLSSSIVFDTCTLTNSSNGPPDIFIVKYDGNGNAIWTKGAYSIGDEYVNSIAINDLGDITVTGYFHYPYIAFDGDTLVNSDSSGMTYKIFIAQINENNFSLIEPLQNTEQRIFAYPNPASDRINISGIERKMIIKFYDILGNTIMEKEIETDQSFETDKLNSGIYIIVAENGIDRIYTKIIISK